MLRYVSALQSPIEYFTLVEQVKLERKQLEVESLFYYCKSKRKFRTSLTETTTMFNLLDKHAEIVE